MAFEQTWRWFGPNDPISLKEIKQTGATGIVTALHHIPVGEVWTIDEIQKRKQMIEAEGMTWSVAESLPVHEDIKKRTNRFQQFIDNYKTSLRNLGTCGIDTVCYNFMPVLDWSRTNLHYVCNDGSVATNFESIIFAAFELFILQRPGAEQVYSQDQITKAKKYFATLTDKQKDTLIETVLLGLPGSFEAYTLGKFQTVLNEYTSIGDAELRGHLYQFIHEIIPTAEEAGVFLVIHPDDPPWPLLGLPRVLSTSNDIAQLLSSVDSVHNGLTLCTGSLGASTTNNLVDIAERYANRINFVHLRNVTRTDDHNFFENNHLDGDIDLYGIMKALLLEQQHRMDTGRKDCRLPIRPDHGHLMIPDQNRKGIYPGYSLFGRMRGLAELRGLELGIRRSIGLQ